MYRASGSNSDITFSPFVKVNLYSGVQVFIRKTTVMWLFQEGERVSSDHLFCVRATQPFSSETTKHEQKSEDRETVIPLVKKDVKVGEICAFMHGEKWSVGKVLQFQVT